MNIKQLICQSCGANQYRSIGFDKYICEFCGTVVQEHNNSIVRLEVATGTTEQLQVCLIADGEFLRFVGKEEADKLMKSKICEQISLELMHKNLIRIYEDYNPMRMQKKYIAKLDVVRW